MTKMPGLWRAQNPILFISFHLCLGILIGQVISENYFSKYSLFFILFISLILLCIFPKINWISNLALVTWGIVMNIMSKQGWILSFTLLNNLTQNVSSFFIHKIDLAIKNKEAANFAKGLLLGYRSGINKELYTAYKQLGLLHIIAISGMHLEIIFKSLHIHTQSYAPNKIFKLFFLLILLFLVVIYTLMTGASPSVVRAALFFCLYAIGRFLNASIYTLNLITGGILCMLIFSWPSISSIGLQLSYGAIFGIYIWYPFFFKLLQFKNPLLLFVWSNLSISMAAQMGTLPIIAFHFHQISSIVLISNCIMVPLSNILLYGIVILMLVPNHFHLLMYAGWIIEKYITTLNQGIVHYVNTMPIGQAEILMDTWDLGFYFLGMFWLYRWLKGIKNVNLLYLLTTITLWCIKKLFS